MLLHLFVKLLEVLAIRHLTEAIFVETTSGSFCVNYRVCHLVERISEALLGRSAAAARLLH